MKHQKSQLAVPKTGAALLITPKGSDKALSQLVSLGILALSSALRHGAETYIFRFENGRKGLVFTEPVPQPLIDLITEQLDVKLEAVRLEHLEDLRPSVRLSPTGFRLYVTLEQAAEREPREAPLT